MTDKILIMAGGTGGHVFPALAVAEAMRQRGWQVSWLGTEKGLEGRVVPAHGFEIDWLSVSGMRGKGVIGKFAGIFNLLQACLQARRVLHRRVPDVVLGMGGFVAGPGGLMAKWLGIPLVIHEQNRVPGTTNRWLVKLAASKVLEGFPNSFAPSVSAIYTGNPLREAFKIASVRTPWTADTGRHLRVLILGGSQGAKILNEVVPEALASFENLDIKHQTGSVMQADVIRHYRDLGLQADVQAFIDDMSQVYHWADLIICRAGAMTVSEVAVCGLPAIFVPLAHAIDDHQTANARYLADAGAAVLLPQAHLTVSTLRAAIQATMNTLPEMSLAAYALAKPNATEYVTEICVAEALK